MDLVLTATEPLETPLPRISGLAVELGFVSAAGLAMRPRSANVSSCAVELSCVADKLVAALVIVPADRLARQTEAGNFAEHCSNAGVSRRVIAQHLAGELEPLLECETSSDRRSDGNTASFRTLLAGIRLRA